MKLADLKAYKTKVNGLESTIVKISEMEGKAIRNVLFALGFKESSNFYYKSGVVKVVGEAKNEIKRGIYEYQEQTGKNMIPFGGCFRTAESAMKMVDGALTFEDLDDMLKQNDF